MRILRRFARLLPFRLRRIWFLWGPTHRHSCQKCGFLAFQNNPFKDKIDEEATIGVRRTVAAEGQMGWFVREHAVDCYRHLWDWELSQASVETITYEANRQRVHCRGFYTYSPGRSPEAHLTLENERRGYRYQRRLAWLAFLGGLVGALIGAAVSLLTMKKP